MTDAILAQALSLFNFPSSMFPPHPLNNFVLGVTHGTVCTKPTYSQCSARSGLDVCSRITSVSLLCPVCRYAAQTQSVLSCIKCTYFGSAYVRSPRGCMPLREICVKSSDWAFKFGSAVPPVQPYVCRSDTVCVKCTQLVLLNSDLHNTGKFVYVCRSEISVLVVPNVQLFRIYIRTAHYI